MLTVPSAANTMRASARAHTRYTPRSCARSTSTSPTHSSRPKGVKRGNHLLFGGILKEDGRSTEAAEDLGVFTLCCQYLQTSPVSFIMCREDLLPSVAGKHYQCAVCRRCGQKHVEQSRVVRDLSWFNTDDISKGCLLDVEEV